MSDSEEWRATHRSLSEVDLRFREIARSSPELLARDSFRGLEGNKDLLKYNLQPWPTLIGRQKLEAFKRVSLRVADLLASVPQRLLGNDPARIAEFYQLGSPVVAEILFSRPSGLETLVSRGDFIDTADDFKCIEFNFTPNLGGWETPILIGLHLAVPATAAVLRELDIEARYTDTMLEFFLLILDHLESRGLTREGELTFAFIGRNHLQPVAVTSGTDYLNAEIVRALSAAKRGDLQAKAVICSYNELVTTREGVFYGARRVHAILEFCDELTPTPVYRSFKAGQLVLVNGPLEPILSTKRNVALLSQFANSDVFSAEERAFVQKHVPWTRLALPGAVEFEGERCSLEDLLRARQERFVLKDATSSGGKGVLLGRFTPKDQWRKAIDTALANGRWVVQEHWESLPYLYQSGDYGCSIHDVIWGPFVFAGTYGGAILRMQPKANGGAVNLSLHATEGILLEI